MLRRVLLRLLADEEDVDVPAHRAVVRLRGETIVCLFVMGDIARLTLSVYLYVFTSKVYVSLVSACRESASI